MGEAEGRVSATEDSHSVYITQLIAMEKTMGLLQQKVDDLENCSRRENLKIINLPEK
uniref:Uncharacterized protein n=1 Tax=Anguilla anguilla TaxID=7936 RepID=A0A0E9USY8_ANGAN